MGPKSQWPFISCFPTYLEVIFLSTQKVINLYTCDYLKVRKHTIILKNIMSSYGLKWDNKLPKHHAVPRYIYISLDVLLCSVADYISVSMRTMICQI